MKYGMILAVLFVVVTYIGYNAAPVEAGIPPTIEGMKTCVMERFDCDYVTMMKQIKPEMDIPLTTGLLTSSCTAEELAVLDSDNNCYVSDIELLNAIDYWANGQLSDNCLLNGIDDWAETDMIPGCTPGVTTTTIPGVTTTTIPGVAPGVEHFPLPSVVSKTLSVSTTKQIDTNHADGEVLYLYGKWVLMKDGAIVETVEEELTTSSFSHTLSQNFVEDGNYLFTIVLKSASSHFDHTINDWTAYTYIEEDREMYPFTVGYPQPPTPVWTLIFDSFINGLDVIWNIIGGWIGFL